MNGKNEAKDLVKLDHYKNLDDSTFKDKALQEQINFLSLAIDWAWSKRDEKLLGQSQKLINQLLNADIGDVEMTELLYFMGNSWAALKEAKEVESNTNFEWELTELEKELVYLRRAAQHEGFQLLSSYRQSQILTNTANCLSYIGRPAEALHYWNLVLKNNPEFYHALGNRGCGAWKYGYYLNNSSQSAHFYMKAKSDLKEATSSKFTDAEAFAHFQKELLRLPKIDESYLRNKKKSAELVSERRQSYIDWCLNEKLFLNPLNDIKQDFDATGDNLALPNIVTSEPTMPMVFDRFNLLKQEFVTARHLFYISQESDEPHYADRDVELVNTLDYQLYSVRLEYMKLAFRSSYSILDKTAFFINDYFDLNINEKKVFFHSIWYNKEQKTMGLRDVFKNSKNWSLRGLFWLSKDVFEKDTEFTEALAPDAQEINKIRNYLEHKYVSLYDSSGLGVSVRSGDGIVSLEVEDLIQKTTYLLRLTRSVLINLSMAIGIEESKNSEFQKKTVSIALTNIEDEWKRSKW